MARHSADRKQGATAPDDAEHEPDAEETAEPDEQAPPERTAQADTFWSDVRVDPIEIALPGGVGYTLRAYRDPDDLSPVPGEESEDEDTDDEPGRPDDEADDDERDEDEAEPVEDEESEDEESDDEDGHDESEDEDEEDEDEEEDSGEPEEVPVFLSAQGRLLLFHSVEGLVDYITSDATHALRGVDTYETLASGIQPDFVAPTEEDRYELDLVVSNLRGGHDAWEPDLVVKAGELARDLGYALRLPSVLNSLAPGSPLDDLDEAMRAAAGGGLGGFRGRRRMRKIPAQQAALGWRTIIGKISAAVDWRD